MMANGDYSQVAAAVVAPGTKRVSAKMRRGDRVYAEQASCFLLLLPLFPGNDRVIG